MKALHMRNHKRRGFTLMEMMIVVAIIGLLAAIAVPSYLQYTRKGQRAAARAAIMAAMQQQERFFTQNNTYLAIATPLTGGSAQGFRMYSGDQGPTAAKYGLTAAACAGSTIAQCVRITASPANGWSDPDAGNIWMQSNGTRGCDGAQSATPGVCW
jgi:type IV pilus assembly protein PilE